jgi:predicted SAM-dependent methyltransferase
MRLNLGCGHDKREGWLNVDASPAAGPDQLVDLESLPWPWPDDAAEEVLLKHVLEHLGQRTETYLGIMRELWRVCRHGAKVRIVVPHPRHDHYLNDPTHVRPITPQGLELFSQRKNREWREKGIANSTLALHLGIDFEIEKVSMVPDETWRQRLESGEVDRAQLAQAMRAQNNVIAETTVVLTAIKQRHV